MNYQDLNKITVKNHHLLSLINETLDRFSKVKQFTKLNLKNIYHHFRIQCKDKWKITFCTHYNHFMYMIMLFNLINAFVIFQTYINKILTESLNDFYIVYLNDILINWSRDSSIHDVNYESFDSILCLNRSQKSQEISIQRSLNDFRTLHDQKSQHAEFSSMRQYFF